MPNKNLFSTKAAREDSSRAALEKERKRQAQQTNTIETATTGMYAGQKPKGTSGNLSNNSTLNQLPSEERKQVFSLKNKQGLSYAQEEETREENAGKGEEEFQRQAKSTVNQNGGSWRYPTITREKDRVPQMVDEIHFHGGFYPSARYQPSYVYPVKNRMPQMVDELQFNGAKRPGSTAPKQKSYRQYSIDEDHYFGKTDSKTEAYVQWRKDQASNNLQEATADYSRLWNAGAEIPRTVGMRLEQSNSDIIKWSAEMREVKKNEEEKLYLDQKNSLQKSGAAPDLAQLQALEEKINYAKAVINYFDDPEHPYVKKYIAELEHLLKENKALWDKLDEKYGRKQVDDWLSYIKMVENKVWMEQETAALKEMGYRDPAAASGLSLLFSPFSGTGFLSALGQRAKNYFENNGRPTDYNSIGWYYPKATKALREGTENRIEDSTAHIVGSDISGRNMWSQIYDEVLSLADDATKGLFGPLAVPMGYLSKGTDIILSGKEQGMTDDEVLEDALFLLAFETALNTKDLEKVFGEKWEGVLGAAKEIASKASDAIVYERLTAEPEREEDWENGHSSTEINKRELTRRAVDEIVAFFVEQVNNLFGDDSK